MQEDRKHLCRFYPKCPVIGKAGHASRQVMVLPEEAVPALSVESFLPVGKDLLQAHEIKRDHIPLFLPGDLVNLHVFKLKHHGEFGPVRVAVELRALHIRAPGFSDRHQAGSVKGFPAHLTYIGMQRGGALHEAVVRILSQMVHDVQAEPAYPPILPPVDHSIELRSERRIIPVQIRLLDRKLMEVILTQFGHPLPCRTAETGFQPIRRRHTVAVPPDVVVVIGVLPALFCLPEPAVFVRGVVQHQIHDDPDAAFSRFRDQAVHICQCPEDGIDILIVRDVVPVVVLG